MVLLVVIAIANANTPELWFWFEVLAVILGSPLLFFLSAAGQAKLMEF